MLLPVLMLAGVCLLVVLIVAIAMWFDPAVGSHRVVVRLQAAGRRWQPPFVRGRELLNWAREMAAELVGKRLAGPLTGATPLELAGELHAGATRAMLPLATEAERQRTVPCPDRGQGMIGVTAPEAIAIADYIRRDLLRGETKRIHDLALENASRLANLDHTAFDPAETPCPLQGDDHVCCAFGTRPLRCRPLHAAMIARRMGPEASRDQEHDHYEQTVEQGIEMGFTDALKSAGRDGYLYELNSALVAALDTPSAAERWAKGEDVFAGCKRYQ